MKIKYEISWLQLDRMTEDTLVNILRAQNFPVYFGEDKLGKLIIPEYGRFWWNDRPGSRTFYFECSDIQRAQQIKQEERKATVQKEIEKTEEFYFRDATRVIDLSNDE